MTLLDFFFLTVRKNLFNAAPEITKHDEHKNPSEHRNGKKLMF